MDHTQQSIISIDALQQKLDTLVSPIQKTVLLPLSQALGKICAQPIFSPIGLPTQAVSMMDGYAINLNERYDKYFVIERIPAGMMPTKKIKENQCTRIFTGAVIPEGADVVIPQEMVERTRQTIQLKDNAILRVGKHIRQANETLKKDSLLIDSGLELNSLQLALCASVGVERIECMKPLSIALFTSGNECIPVGSPLRTGEIYNSNQIMMQTILQKMGFHNIVHQHLRDDRAQTEQALLLAAEKFDVIITTGGVSVGEEDHIGASAKRLGKLLSWRVNMKPGKPLTLATIKNAIFIGLPGNPVAAFTSFTLFGRRILSIKQGKLETHHISYRIPIGQDYQTHDRETVLPAKLISTDFGMVAQVIPTQSAADISALAKASGLIQLAANQQTKRFDLVSFIPFDTF